MLRGIQWPIRNQIFEVVICRIIKVKHGDLGDRISLLLIHNKQNVKRDRGIILHTACLGAYLKKIGGKIEFFSFIS